MQLPIFIENLVSQRPRTSQIIHTFQQGPKKVGFNIRNSPCFGYKFTWSQIHSLWEPFRKVSKPSHVGFDVDILVQGMIFSK